MNQYGRRRALRAAAAALAAGALALGWLATARAQAGGRHGPARRWMDLAFAMQRRAQSWGDQPYGAVVVLDGALAGEGPSRVVRDMDGDAHAERVAIRDAQRRLGRTQLAGAVLYSTSRPCSRCERAAFEAGIAGMIHGEVLQDAGPPGSV